jgi:hypothetical protein
MHQEELMKVDSEIFNLPGCSIRVEDRTRVIFMAQNEWGIPFEVDITGSKLAAILLQHMKEGKK